MTSSELLRATLPPAFSLPVEVRERQDGTWRVWYPDPAWIPCESVCRLKDRDKNHKHDYDQKWIESTYVPDTYVDALEWAEVLDARNVRVVLYATPAERKRQIKEALTNTA